jgi:type I restriction enzyme S subunit
MSEDWKTYTLKEISDLIVDCPHSTPIWTKNGIVVLRSNNIRNGKLNFDNESFTDEYHYSQRVKRAIPKGGDLVITREAPMGEICMLPNGLKCCLGQRMVLIRPSLKVDNSFLLYAIQAKEVQNQIMIYEGTGSTVSNLRIPVLESLKIPFPSLPEQRSIASILSAIDEKIELNLQMNKTLEEMATALYKHWFVDFGPFKDGEFIDSELGMIPKGWEVKGILEIAQLLSGGTPKTTVSEYWDGDIHWVSAKDIGNGGNIYINETEKTITEVGVKNSSTKILPEDTVILVARGSVGKYGMIAKPMAMNQSCYGLYTKSEFSQGLVYLMVSVLISQFQRVAYGSVFDTITTSTFESTIVISPPKEIVSKLKDLIDPLFLELKQNTIENQSLTTFRDTLLPKLISGEVRVKDAEKALAEVL